MYKGRTSDDFTNARVLFLPSPCRSLKSQSLKMAISSHRSLLCFALLLLFSSFSLAQEQSASTVVQTTSETVTVTTTMTPCPDSAVLQSCAASMDGALPSPTPPGWNYSGVVRRYYVAAEEIEWDLSLIHI